MGALPVSLLGNGGEWEGVKERFGFCTRDGGQWGLGEVGAPSGFFRGS